MQHLDSHRTDLGLAILRVVAGVIFVAHGAQKVFVFGLGNVAGNFAKMGIPLAGITGPLVGLVELLGGLALIFGLLTRLAALGLAIDMLGAIWLVHLAKGFFAPQGFEYPLMLLAVSATLVATGAGRYALDHAIGTRRHRAAGPVAHERRRGERRRVPHAA